MPSIRKHHPSLLAAITSPASDGPTSRAMFTMDELMAMALLRSARSPTICTMKDWRPGMSKALMRPCMMLRARIQWIVIRPENVNAASASDCTMASVCVQISTCLRLSRSTQTPAKGARRNVGIWPAKLTVPSSSAECVSLYTSHAVAMRVIHVPMSEMVCPPKKRRKLRCRSARHAWDTPPAARGLAAPVLIVGFWSLTSSVSWHSPSDPGQRASLLLL